MKWLCKYFGVHDWFDWKARERKCYHCTAHQRLEFYSNRTQEWVNVNAGN